MALVESDPKVLSPCCSQYKPARFKNPSGDFKFVILLDLHSIQFVNSSFETSLVGGVHETIRKARIIRDDFILLTKLWGKLILFVSSRFSTICSKAFVIFFSHLWPKGFLLLTFHKPIQYRRELSSLIIDIF